MKISMTHFSAALALVCTIGNAISLQSKFAEAGLVEEEHDAADLNLEDDNLEDFNLEDLNHEEFDLGEFDEDNLSEYEIDFYAIIHAANGVYQECKALPTPEEASECI